MSGEIMICQNCKWEIYEEGIGYICTNPDSDSCGLVVLNCDWCYDFESE